ncbi:MAG TPA: hypothetical protein VGR16_06710 [Thermomicrobiales bacterium]|nr:hypothetical protein [Thermomicrobiales bacterium]
MKGPVVALLVRLLVALLIAFGPLVGMLIYLQLKFGQIGINMEFLEIGVAVLITPFAIFAAAIYLYRTWYKG